MNTEAIAPALGAHQDLPKEEKKDKGLVIAGWIFAFLMPIVGFFIGLAAAIRGRAGHGVGIMATSVLVPVIIIIAMVGSAASSVDTSTDSVSSTKQVAQKSADKPKAKKAEMTSSQENAVESAKTYLNTQAFSKKGLIQQLSSDAGDGFPRADAVFAVNHIDVDWNEQAVKSARQYLDTQSFSRSALIEQLSSSSGEGFTLAQAQYAVGKVY
jgi:Host cell surface-exposed lipoprotein